MNLEEIVPGQRKVFDVKYFLYLNKLRVNIALLLEAFLLSLYAIQLFLAGVWSFCSIL